MQPSSMHKKDYNNQLVRYFTAPLFLKVFFLVGAICAFLVRIVEIVIIYPIHLCFILIKQPSRFFKNITKKNKIVVKIKYFIVGCLFGLFFVVIYQSYLLVRSLPNPQLIGRINYPVSTKIFDRRGKLLFEIYREQNRTPISLSKLPSYVAAATIAIEDKDFYRHNGVSFFGGIIRAIKEYILTRSLQGGSTITQQLVKSALLTPERTMGRKIREIILALLTERLFTKNQILEMYLNQVSYGGLSYGIEEATQTYFGKSSINLTLSEAAFLAGLPQAPSFYSPYNNPFAAKLRRDEVLKKLKEQKYINDKQFKNAMAESLAVNSPKTPIKASHFVFYVKSLLEQEYGIKRTLEGGLRVYTSLDLMLQETAEKILEEELTKIQNLHVGNGAILTTVPKTGEIIVMVGSRDYFATPSGSFNVVLAPRQPGSLIKPIMYSLALEKGYTAATFLEDTPVVFNIPGTKPYRPINYDGRFHGRIPLRYALGNSYNVPAVKVLAAIGVSQFIEHGQAMGISTWNESQRFGLSLTLGGGEIKMIDIAEAFSAFANKGNKVKINPFLKIEDYLGQVIYQNKSIDEKKVLSSGAAFIISDILSDPMARRWAFGAKSSLEIPGFKVAVKTGTTNDKRDNWTVGFTPQILTAVWVGNNDNSPMNPFLTSGITGAAPIWNRLTRTILQEGWDLVLSKDETIDDFERPDDVVAKTCYFGKVEYFIKGTEKNINCVKNFFSVSPTPKY